ncbi:MAG: hypothetical protein IPH45_19780 [Bacteroidales bacterium]|nr:hypothetical protein [Bacteroidales bacterium]
MNMIDIGLYVAYLAIFIAAAALLLFPVLSMVKGDAKNTKATLFRIIALIAIFLISYLISPADQGPFYEKMQISPSASKLIGAGLISTYIIFASVIGITLYSVVIKWFK